MGLMLCGAVDADPEAAVLRLLGGASAGTRVVTKRLLRDEATLAAVAAALDAETAAFLDRIDRPDVARRMTVFLSGDALAFRDARTGRDRSFREVDAAANGLAGTLRDRGLAEGDGVACLCLNGAGFFVVLMACQKAGLILCPLNWREPADELADVLVPMTPRSILHDDAMADLAAALAKAAAIPAETVEDGGAFRQPGRSGSVGMIPADRPWYLLCTSGTTGRPKAVIQMARMAWVNAVNIGQAVHMTAADRSVNCLQIFHTARINLSMARTSIRRRWSACWSSIPRSSRRP